MRATGRLLLFGLFTALAAATANPKELATDDPAPHPCVPWPPCQVLISPANPGKPGGGLNPKDFVLPEARSGFTYDSDKLRFPQIDK